MSAHPMTGPAALAQLRAELAAELPAEEQGLRTAVRQRVRRQLGDDPLRPLSLADVHGRS